MLHPPGLPASLRGRLVERERWEWRVADGGDPLRDVQDFLLSHGLDLRDLSSGARPAPARRRAAAGAALLLGAQAGPPEARRAGTGMPTPCPEVPDLAVVACSVAPHRRRPPVARPPAVGAWRPSWTPEAHGAAVAAVRDAIARGDVYQVNIVGHRSAPAGDVTPGDLAFALSRRGDTPYAGGLAGEDWAVVSASPELFLSVTAGEAVTRPIKGTNPRAAGTADRAARAALRHSVKDRAEHVMIVDLERNDLGRVARVGGVKVSELYAVRPLGGVWHGVSEVRAELADGVGLADLLAATFPGGSVTGAPKLAALAELARLEPVGRGPAMGALGWIGPDSFTLGLTIRTVGLAGGRVHLWTGGGITWGSTPALEVAEAEAKAAPVLAALGAAAEQDSVG